MFAGRAGQRYGVFAPGIDWVALALGTIASRGASAADHRGGAVPLGCSAQIVKTVTAFATMITY